MLSRIAASLACLAALLSLSPTFAALPVPDAPPLAAESYLLLDYHSGRVLAEQNADQRVEPASITKLMTAYVIFQALESGSIALDDKVLISEKAWRMPGSRMFIEVGKRISVENLIKGLIIQSGNDASVALAEYVAGTENAFVSLMNNDAAQLGMTNTHFVNVTGLPDPEHYSTARDIAILGSALIHDFPEYYKYYSQKEFTWNGITQNNRNDLLYRDPSVDGMKTGHTDSAGYCLVTSAKRDDMRLISVVMGTESERARTDASQALLNYGFRFFETHQLYAANAELTTARVWKGASDAASLGLQAPLYVTIPRGSYKNLDAFMDLSTRIIAPVSTEQPLGKVKITLNGEPVAEQPLYALQPVAEGGLWRRAVDSILLLFE